VVDAPSVPATSDVPPTRSVTEQALTAAGIDTAAAEDIKRRQDAQALTEMSLRNRATREGWVDSPRFAEELAALEAQRTSLRDEIGDDAYDRYLVALGRPNRVRVDDVMMESPAEAAGLQMGDMIVRYGDTRIFAPSELVAETHSGSLGDAVRLEIIRSGERLEVEVPRGLLGIRVGAIQGTPESS
jgi:C-terminal processing protease CtpA/Prc